MSAPLAEWNFAVMLDGRPIGSHRFALTTEARDAANPTLTSEARFDLALLGVTLYRYRHRAREQWRGDCLVALDAWTDDDGKQTSVRAREENGRLAIATATPDAASAAPSRAEPDTAVAAKAGDRVTASGCVMTFAYWNPALRTQRRLLDPGSGRLERVAIEALANATIDVRGTPTPVRGVRINGLAQPIDVWYSGDRWSGLDTIVAGNRRLSYRLQ